MLQLAIGISSCANQLWLKRMKRTQLKQTDGTNPPGASSHHLRPAERGCRTTVEAHEVTTGRMLSDRQVTDSPLSRR